MLSGLVLSVSHLIIASQPLPVFVEPRSLQCGLPPYKDTVPKVWVDWATWRGACSSSDPLIWKAVGKDGLEETGQGGLSLALLGINAIRGTGKDHTLV